VVRGAVKVGRGARVGQEEGKEERGREAMVVEL